MTYRIQDGIVEILLDETFTFAASNALLDSIHQDPAVPPNSPILIATENSDAAFPKIPADARVENMKRRLGEKLGGAVALVSTNKSNKIIATELQRAGARLGIRYGLFDTADAARAWLRAYVG